MSGETPAGELEVQESIGARIKAALNGAGMSPADLAEQTGISHAALAGILDGGRAPKVTVLMLIADTVGASLEQLMSTDAASRAAYSSGLPETSELRSALLGFVDLNARLDDQGIPSV